MVTVKIFLTLLRSAFIFWNNFVTNRDNERQLFRSLITQLADGALVAKDQDAFASLSMEKKVHQEVARNSKSIPLHLPLRQYRNCSQI